MKHYAAKQKNKNRYNLYNLLDFFLKFKNHSAD